MIYFCREENRRRLVRQHPVLNGVDYIEVVDREESVRAERQRALRVFFVKEPSADLLGYLSDITVANVRITGGDRIQGIAPDRLDLIFKDDAKKRLDYLRVHVTQRGDFSTYTLHLVHADSAEPLQFFNAQSAPLLDPALASVDFSFKVECPSDLDCRELKTCPPKVRGNPELDYVAKDYASFRRLMLDRLALLSPGWRERNAADLGVALVEMLAYVGDHLSYRQDAIGTEAYLGTARQRISVRRHARLLDYAMHDGCNARVWVQVGLRKEAPAGLLLPRRVVRDGPKGPWVSGSEPVPVVGVEGNVRRTRFATRVAPEAVIADEQWPELRASQKPEVFEPLHDATLYPGHNRIPFHTWGDSQCCLPKGATQAALRDSYTGPGEPRPRRLHLKAGDVLILKEERGPKTGSEADADPTHRHAVRLTRVTPNRDEVIVPDGEPTPYVEIEWDAADALPFALSLSSVTDDGEPVKEVSAALGNIVLADHGMTILKPERLGTVPSANPALSPVDATDCGCGASPSQTAAPLRFQPRLQAGPLTQAATTAKTEEVEGLRQALSFDPAKPAAAAFDWDMGRLMPAIRLGDGSGDHWVPRRDLLSSDGFAPDFVVEVDNDGRVGVRFGDGVNGLHPHEGTQFWAVYRVGNGTRGNIGAEAIAHVVAGEWLDAAPWIESITNPLAAQGGVDPQTLEQVRQEAPAAIRVQERAVTPEDYAERAGQHPDVQRSTATLRWTGSWATVFLTVDRRGGRAVDATFEKELRDSLEPYRMAGHDLEIDGPRYVPLELELQVCVADPFFRSDVISTMRTAFDNRLHADGTCGFFHPDQFTFGQPVLLSRIYAEAQRIAGVQRVEVTILRRQGATLGQRVPSSGKLEIGRLEIARLDNDPNFPNRGVLQLKPLGGR